MPSTSVAVALSLSLPQVAMSAAPASTASAAGEADGEPEVGGEPDPDGVAFPAAVEVAGGGFDADRAAAADELSTAPPACERRTRLRAPNSRINVAAKTTRPI